MPITAAGLYLCHALQFAAMLSVLTNLIQYYVYLGKQQSDGSLWRRFSPAAFVTLAFVLMMVHPTAFILKDLSLLGPVCNSDWGSRALRICTHLGFASLFYGAITAT
mmetsp:Transcript_2376/g.5034  ORF Transcript_2376/g.5034 Transcript_2376/m.5034 type:complete len:107 (-) Transcript_2376:103-423(-)